MSNHDVPEIASIYGGPDSDTFADGRSLDAHIARVCLTNSNRLAAKGEQIMALDWPVRRGATDLDGHHRWAPATSWTRLLPPFPIAYRRGLRTATLSVLARVSEDHTILMQVATKSQPFARGADETTTNTIELTGDSDNDVDVYTKTGLWIDPSGYDELDIRILGESTTDLADTDGGPVQEDPAETQQYRLNRIHIATTLSGFTPNLWLTTTGAEIEFLDGVGASIGGRRLIVGHTQSTVTGGTALTYYFSPSLTTSEQTDAIAGDDFFVYRLPSIGVVSISLTAEERAF